MAPSARGPDADVDDRRLHLSDLFRLRLPVDLALSPNGRQAAVVVEQQLKKADRTIRNLWLVDLERDGLSRLTRHLGRESSPRFSPDGRCLAFLAERPKDLEAAESEDGEDVPDAEKEAGPDKEPRTQVWCLDLEHGGEPWPLTRLDEGVEAYAWAPDGRRLVVAARSPSPEQRRHLKALRDGKEPHVLDRTQHKFDGRGFLDDVPTHLFVVDRDGGDARQITHGSQSERHPCWSPDGRFIAFQSNRTGDADNNRRTDLWLVQPDGRDARRLTRGDLSCGRPVVSPDGAHVATTASFEPENEYVLSHLVILDVADALPVADLARCVGEGWSEIGGVVPDAVEGDPVENARRYPKALDRTPCRVPARALDRVAVGSIRWLDASRLLCLVGDRGQTRLLAVDLDQATARLAQPCERDITIEAMDAAGGQVGAVLASPEGGREVASLAAASVGDAGVGFTRSTAFFAALVGARRLSPYRRLTFRDADGVEVEGLVAVPPGFDPERPAKTPLLVSIHGGPMAYDAPTFRFEKQYWAAQGYLVLMVNYRGSTSYGEAFCTAIRGDWGPREHDDVMSGVEHLVRLGWADPQHLFVTGFSMGGIMTNWAVGHTDRFRAAVSEHGVWDYAAAYGTDDCHLWWQDDLGVPWQNPEAYRRTSPSAGVGNVRTPVLIMAGSDDWRCPLDQSELMYMALRKRGVETRLVVYPGEHHAVSKPSRALDRLRRIGAWLEAHGGLPMVGGDGAAAAAPATTPV
jgi:dipeptidyl aminopeptidase/acylaminoacyl peptidase